MAGICSVHIELLRFLHWHCLGSADNRGAYMVRLTPRFSFEEVDLFLAQRDTFTAWIVWSLLEGLSLFVFPSFRLLSGDDKLLTWLLFTVPLGLVGAVLVGASSSLLQYANQHLQSRTLAKRLALEMGQLTGLIGLAGIGFPMIYIIIEFWLMMSQSLA